MFARLDILLMDLKNTRICSTLTIKLRTNVTQQDDHSNHCFYKQLLCHLKNGVRYVSSSATIGVKSISV